MKKTLIVLCGSIALVGCDQNRGGLGNNEKQQTGASSSRDTIYPSSGAFSTNTNTTVTAPPSEAAPTAPYQSGSEKNSVPKD